MWTLQHVWDTRQLKASWQNAKSIFVMLTRMVELKNGLNEFEKLGFTDIDRVGAEGSFDIVMSLQKQTKSINLPPVTAESLEETGADTK